MDVQYLYHCTSAKNAESIISDQMLRAHATVPNDLPAVSFGTRSGTDDYGLPSYKITFGDIRFIMEPMVEFISAYRLYFYGYKKHSPMGRDYVNQYFTVLMVSQCDADNYHLKYQELDWYNNPYFWYSIPQQRFQCREWNAIERAHVTVAICNSIPLWYCQQAYNAEKKEAVWCRGKPPR